ncbi:MAG: 2-oxo acid dehydrogenase subunit E2 [bacterium]|nr:2-oxo acid dehydrogenase subunit E2 [bacterium]
MAKVDMIMPQLGESITEGTIVKWHVKVGDKVERDKTILEVATDKATLEVPAPASGIITEILANPDQTVAINTVIARIETDISATTTPKEEEKVARPKDFPEPVHTEQVDARSTSPHDGSDRGGIVTREFSRGTKFTEEVKTQVQAPIQTLEQPVEKRFYSPVVMKMATEHGISMEELSRIPGTGLDGRVSKKDLERYLAAKSSQSKRPEPTPISQTPTPPPPPPTPAPSVPVGEVSGYIMVPMYPQYQATWKEGDRIEVQPMEYIRRKIAEHMVYSKHIAPHVYSNIEVDMTKIVKWRETNKERIKEREGVNVTPTAFIAFAAVAALKEHPWMNASVRGTDVIVRKDYHIGIATATEKDLIVPVIKNADQLSVLGIAKQIATLAAKARNKTITPEELQGGTFTITNAGIFGNIWGAPIINQPQVAILSTGAIVKRPWVVTDVHGEDAIAIRHIMQLTLSYDHRIVDGMLAGKFLSFLKRTLETLKPDELGM